MTIDIYINNSDNRKIEKDLTLIKTLNNVYLKNDENKDSINLELAYDSDIENANYCYIRELGYYYFMSEPTFSKQRMFKQLTTDLLMTYKDDILEMECIIARQESKYNVYLRDDKLPIKAQQDIFCYPFPSGFSETESNILIVNGG